MCCVDQFCCTPTTFTRAIFLLMTKAEFSQKKSCHRAVKKYFSLDEPLGDRSVFRLQMRCGKMSTRPPWTAFTVITQQYAVVDVALPNYNQNWQQKKKKKKKDAWRSDVNKVLMRQHWWVFVWREALNVAGKANAGLSRHQVTDKTWAP